MINKLFYISRRFFALFVFLLLLASCDNDVYYLRVEPKSLEFTAEKSWRRCAIITNIEQVDISCNSSWCTFERNEEELIVNVTANTDSVERNCKILLSSSEMSYELLVKQDGKEFVNPAPEDYYYELNSFTRIADSLLVVHIISSDLTNLEFVVSKDVPSELLPAVGECIVFNKPTEIFPQGMLAQIQEVTELSDSYKVRYSQVGLSTCFKDITIPETAIELNSRVSKIVDAQGNPVAFSLARKKAADAIRGEGLAEAFTIEIPQVAIPIGDNFEITPQMSADIKMRLYMNMTDWSISTFDMRVESDIKVGADFDLFVDAGGYIYKKLMTIYILPVAVGPIVVTPSIQVDFIYNPTGKVGLHASMSYERTVVSNMHYDEVNGISCSQTFPDKDDEGWQPIIFGPKISGGLSYGLGVGPHVGIYGDAITAGLSMSAQLKHELSVVDNPGYVTSIPYAISDFNWDYYSKLIQEAELNTSFTTHLYGSFSLMYQISPPNGESPDIDIPIDSRKLIPSVGKTYTIHGSGQQQDFNFWLKDKHAICGDMRVICAAGAIDMSVPITLDEKVVSQLNNGVDSVMVSVPLNLEDNMYYDIYVEMNIFADYWVTLQYFRRVSPISEDNEKALRAILADILKIREGVWEDCNWEDESVSAEALKNVKMNGNHYDIVLPANWKVSGSLTVSNHTQNLKDFGAWTLAAAEPDNIIMESITINDEHCKEVYLTDHVKNFAFHGKVDNEFVYLLPNDAEVIDISGTIIKEYNLNKYSYLNPKQIILDNCANLATIVLYPSDDGKRTTMPQISTKNCPALESATVYLMTIPENSIGNFAAKNLCLSGCTIQSQNALALTNKLSIIGGTYATLNFNNVPFKVLDISSYPVGESVTISSCNNLTSVSVYRTTLQSLSVTNCPALTTLLAYDCGMSSFEASNLQAILELNCSQNKNLTGIMLPIFDEMRTNKKTLSYDQRYYSYYETSNGFTWKDLGYGYYYEGEPERGYHIK